jgi:hypothetical protein
VQLVEGGVPDPAAPKRVEFVSPPSQEVDLDRDHDVGDALRFRMLEDLYEDTEEAEAPGELLVAVGDK